MIENSDIRPGMEIAIIGMAGRFPGAKNIDAFWENLKNGVESIAFFSNEELIESLVPPGDADDPGYVKAKGLMAGIEYFDASFFRYTPSEAESMDPQVRLFHEYTWTALEDAGYDPGTYKGLIGIYAGARDNSTWQNLVSSTGTSEGAELFAAHQFTDKDHMCTRVAYKLNLKGPAFTLSTQCSTSLVAFHLACQGLLSGECDMALAGGACVILPIKSGHFYQEGMVYSFDGHCRPFDARADGIVFGDGVAVVVLKRIEDATADRDHIYALVKATAVNNDGTNRVSYAAPGVEGQAAVIRSAHQVSQVEPESITYIETHGTGTNLGDPIEIEALTLAFDTTKKGFCRIGSVKSNLGHLDAAAGIASLIKTVLALKHRLIPPSLHFEKPNAKIDFASTPFRVNGELTEWKRDKTPLRAGVSSFGIGGTNAHVVLEEWTGAPAAKPITQSPGRTLPDIKSQARGRISSPYKSREYQLILLSARTETALDKMTQNLVEYFKKILLNHGNHENPVNPGQILADAAYTLQLGRRAFQYRRMLVCSTVDEAVQELENPGSGTCQTWAAKDEDLQVVFMFSGQGAQYVNMGLELYQKEPVFREQMDLCFNLLEPLMGPVKPILYPDSTDNNKDDKINLAVYSGPIKFIFDYSMAKLLMKWGIQPHVMIGHSFGEYVAACLAGVFSLEDALKLVALRGRLMDQMPAGAMLSVPLPEEEVKPYLNDELSLAAVNTPSLCIVSGTTPAVETIRSDLSQKGYECVLINFPRASHSRMMDPILPELEAGVRRVTLSKPRIPFISGVTGKLITPGQAGDPGYWPGHMRDTVRFADGISQLIQHPNAIFIQVGAGRGLTLFVNQHPQKNPAHLVTNLLRNQKEEVSDVSYLLDKIGEIWLWGQDIDWEEFYPGEERCRVSLPTYSFEEQRSWKYADDLKRNSARHLGPPGLGKKKNLNDWFYVPSWQPSDWPGPFDQPGVNAAPSCWLLFIDEYGIGEKLGKRLEMKNQEVIRVKQDTKTGFTKIDDSRFTLNPQQDDDYQRLFTRLHAMQKKPGKIIHLWGITGSRQAGEEKELEEEWVEKLMNEGFYCLVNLARALEHQDNTGPVILGVVTNHMRQVYDSTPPSPGKAALVAAVRTIPTEYPNIDCFTVDIVLPEPGSSREATLLEHLLCEFMIKPSKPCIAYRGNYRLVETLAPVRLSGSAPSMQRVPRWKQEGVYLIIGGLGGVGFVFAQHLAKTLKARLVLVGRSAFPGPGDWEKWLSNHDDTNDISRKIRQLQELETAGARVMVFGADVSNLEQMQQVVNRAEAQLGRINGVIHSAMVVDGAVISRRTREMTGNVLSPKVKGTLVLDRLFRNRDLDFFVLCSSIASFTGTIGEVGYCAGNLFQDAYALYKNVEKGNHNYTVSINWDIWQEVGQTVRTAEDLSKRYNKDFRAALKDGILPGEGIEALMSILEREFPQVIVHTRDIRILSMRREQTPAVPIEKENIETATRGTHRKRPKLKSEYAAPLNHYEKAIAETWQKLFGIDQIGILDDFFELGGDSLKAMIMLSKIHKQLEVRIPLSVMFSTPTIKALVEYVTRGEKDRYASIQPVEEKEFYPVSSAQKRMFILNRLKGNETSDNTPGAMAVEGKLDIKRFEEAVKMLIKRHESLRTSFELIEGEVVQRVHKEVDFEIRQMEGENETELNPMMAKFICPFDLNKAPLMRVELAKMPGEKYLLFYDLHHIIRDGASTGIFMGEFVNLFQRFPLPGLRVQYRDFSAWQNKLLQSETIKKQEEYWLNRFSKKIPVLNLPLDYPRPPVQSFAGDFIDFSLSKDLVEKLNRMAKEKGATLYMVLLALYLILLSKYTGQEDIVVGSPIAGRPHPDLENIIGMFVNTLAMRNFPRNDLTAGEFLEEVKRTALEAYENQDYQFEELVERLNIQRDQSRSVLFDTMFDTQNTNKKMDYSLQIPGQETGKLTFKSLTFEEKITQFDIIIHAYESTQTIDFKLRYCTQLFKKESMEMFIENFMEIITTVVNNKDIKLKDIRITHHLAAANPNIPHPDFTF
jgi:acyl transferase domain-containing protein/acyl carrier protein